ncbi:hypothetical protein PR202_ga30114 [Eleusine coracana subsp. coracana]|uniref:Importin N-terminal domain-containing protein n=1 Tax=Eleusine coracana subsp. coracana TaxID=191504 RepID=A0AAV5DLF5_ELECO|nr:hypothetical protein PR202_ga30114 [Eleusine coracana subsp. coracana]
MDLPSLAVVLRAALSHTPDERKTAEASLDQLQFTPQHLVRLLQIIVDGNCDLAVRQVASIHFKNFVSKNWSPTDPEEGHKVPESDKAMVRENILGFITQLPPLLRYISTFLQFADMKIQKQESKAFAQMFQKTYAGKILGCHLQLLNAIRTGGYLPDRVINLILQYLTNSIPKNSMYQLMQPQMDIILFEIIFPLLCFNDNDQMLWDEDPHEYVRKGYDIIEDLYSPRTAAMDFVNELVRKRGKGNLQKFIQFIVGIFMRYDETSIELKPYRQKDGALLAIGTLCDRLKQTDPYKGELERMLVQHVFPEFSSHVGHLRAKVVQSTWLAVVF